MLKTESICYHFKKKTILKNLSLTFEEGRLYTLLGPNGSGKSTLLKSLCHIISPTSGKVFINEKSLTTLSRSDICRLIHLVPQAPSPSFAFTVEEMISMAASLSAGKEKEKIDETIERMQLFHLKNRSIQELSCGERQLVYLARAFATPCPILLLDEPTASLDIAHQLQIWSSIKEICSEGRLVIVATHDLDMAMEYGEGFIILDKEKKTTVGNQKVGIPQRLLQKIFNVSLKKDSPILKRNYFL